jgi:hypothetical protein
MYPNPTGIPPVIKVTPATDGGGKVEPAEVLPGVHNVGFAQIDERARR